MREVEISPLPLERFAELIGPERWSRLAEASRSTRELLDGTVVWNVNATARGGGVAEMLQTILAYGRGAGIDTRWAVLAGEPDFFTVTKRLHNALHGSPGDGGELGARERAEYDSVLERNLEAAAARIAEGDLVLLHDPQTTGMIRGMRELGARVIWRSHIGRDEPNEHTARGWAFLEPYLVDAEAVIVTRATYAPPSVPVDRVRVIPPSIDPFATKNAPIDDEDVVAVLTRVGLLEGEDHGRELRFRRRDGSWGTVRRHRELLQEGPTLPRDARMVLQVSRWDRLKDMGGVMTAFTDHLAVSDDVHLVLAGPGVEGVADDPEGAQVLQECRDQWRALPPDQQRRVRLVCVPMTDVDENAHIVNALQRFARVIVQKSLFEGFGLTVTEAMWKGRPVVASAVGGIQDQIVDGRDGLLLPDPTDLAALGTALEQVLSDDGLAASLGAGAHRRVHADFLGDRHLGQYAQLFAQLVTHPPR